MCLNEWMFSQAVWHTQSFLVKIRGSMANSKENNLQRLQIMTKHLRKEPLLPL